MTGYYYVVPRDSASGYTRRVLAFFAAEAIALPPPFADVAALPSSTLTTVFDGVSDRKFAGPLIQGL